MAQAIIDGLIRSGMSAEKIFASDRSEEARKNIADKYGISSGSNIDACADSDVIVLAVKPQVLKTVCEEIRTHINEDSLVISIAAGINCHSLQAWLGEYALVRCMPNTPAAVGYGASGLYANQLASEDQKQSAQQILSAVGDAFYVKEEHLIDSVTAVSGSGPAYFFLFIEAMAQAGAKLGLNTETAEKLAIQTALGAATLAKQSEHAVDTLRANVTSPNGTTERAVQSFETNNLRKIVEQAMTACAERATELAEELGEK